MGCARRLHEQKKLRVVTYGANIYNARYLIAMARRDEISCEHIPPSVVNAD